MTSSDTWQRFQKYYYHKESIGFSLDVSHMGFDDEFIERMTPKMEAAMAAMNELEDGAVANPDEDRMVGHYWLRAPEIAPTSEIADTINQTLDMLKAFAADVHKGKVTTPSGQPFENVLLIGIGGSALGPQLAASALGGPHKDILNFYTLDNTDPDGIDRTLGVIGNHLDRTLAVVISKSGGTPETRNGMLEARSAYERQGLAFGAHAVAVTSDGSALHKIAEEGKWLAIFPMWDWIGGRTSQTSAVGLLPAALQGLNVDGILNGARIMDELTRTQFVLKNPAALLALMWFWAGDGKGTKDMVIIPYKDRLSLMSKYLQQLIMESLGKEKDLEGNIVEQGIAVYGNKGSTDQHAYVQQLRDGLNNFFVTFIEVLYDREGASIEVDPGVTSGDYLGGFLLGTRAALAEKNRESITITIRRLDSRSFGMLIALFERAVGFYASLVGINAYHQPGVEAGKKAAKSILTTQTKLLKAMADSDEEKTVEGWASAIEEPESAATIFKLLERLAANPSRGVKRNYGATPFETKYSKA